MKFSKNILIILTILPFILNGRIAADSLINPDLDSFQIAIRNDFNEIHKQLDSNDFNLREGNHTKNHYLFFSNISLTRFAGEEIFLNWSPKMNHPSIKAQYNINNGSEELEINKILGELHQQANRKVVVYVVSLVDYPEHFETFPTDDNSDGRFSKQNTNIKSRTYIRHIYGIDQIQKKIEQEIYASESNHEFTTLIVIRINEFQFTSQKSAFKETKVFDSNKNYHEKFTRRHAIKITPARNISQSCILETQSVFESQKVSNLKLFVSTLSNTYRSETCNPSVNCSQTQNLKNVFTNGTHADIFNAVNDLLRPVGQSRKGEPVRYGDAGLSYDLYQKVIFNCIDLTARTNAIKSLLSTSSFQWTSTPYEKIILDLIKYTPAADKNTLLDKLVSEKIGSKTILTVLFEKVDLDEFDKLIELLHLHIKEAKPKPKNRDVQSYFSAGNFQYFGRGVGSSGLSFDQFINSNGKITLISEPSFLSENFYEPGCRFKNETVNLNPYEYVIVCFETNYSLTNKTYTKNSKIFLPACVVYGLFNYENKQRWKSGGELTLDVALLAIGAGEIRAAIKAGQYGYRFVLAIADAGIGSADLYIKYGGLSEQLEASPEGRKFLSCWSRFQLIYGLTSISSELIPKSTEMKRLAGDFTKSRKIIADDGSEIALNQGQLNEINRVAGKSDELAQALKIKENIELSDDAIILGYNLANAEKWIAKIPKTPGVIDLVIHGSGNQFKMLVKKADGTVEEISFDAKSFAGWLIDNKLDKSNIRLLSCSSLESAQDIARALPDNTIIATDGIVRIHSDGGITAVSRDGDGTATDWYRLKGETKTKVSAPQEPGSGIKNKKGNYIGLGIEEKFKLLLTSEKFNAKYKLYMSGDRPFYFSNKLSSEEEMSICFYTDGSASVNAASRGDIPYDDFTRTFGEYLESALDNLDNPFKGTTIGYYSMPSDYIKKNFNKNDFYEPKYFMSSSKDPLISKSHQPNANVIITFIGYNGQQIDKISWFKKEQEVLFNRTSTFKVTESYEKDGLTYITLTEQ